MELNWSLDELYTGFDSPEFLSDFENFGKDLAELNNWCKENLNTQEKAKEKLEHYINVNNKLIDYSTLMLFCALTNEIDSNNNDSVKYMEKFMEIYSENVVATTIFTNFIKEIANLDEIIAESALLKEHEFFLKESQMQAKYVLSQKEEAVLAKIKTTASNAWETLYSNLTSTLAVDYEGEQKPLSVIRNLATDESLDVRKKAYEAEINSFSKIEKAVAACLNAIKGEALTESKLRGYDSILDMTLKKSRMEKESLDAMLDSIKDYLPKLRKYYKKKAEILGDSNGLKYYNIFAPVGEASMKFTYEEAADFVEKNFSTFSKDLGDFAHHAFNNRWIDVEPKEGKSGGAFCAGIHSLKQSRVMLNFSSGSFEAMLTIGHELGHAYHNKCLDNETNLNADYPMPIAETASTFCETLICSAALKNADKKTRLSILENQICGAAQVIVDIYARYVFETNLIKERQNGSLSVEELKKMMVDAQLEAYGDGLDKDTIHPYMWLVKGHYYSAGNNFYNFPYAFGHLFCLGLYSKYLEEGDAFVESYTKLLKATGSASLYDIGKLCGVDINSKEFWTSSLELIVKDIEEYASIEI